MNRKIFAVLLLACLLPAGAFAQDKKAKADMELKVEEALKCARCGGAAVGPGRHCEATDYTGICKTGAELSRQIETQKQAEQQKSRLEDLTNEVIKRAYEKDFEYVENKAGLSQDPHSWYREEVEKIIAAAEEEAMFLLKMEKAGQDIKGLMVQIDIAADKLKAGKYAYTLKKLENVTDELSKSTLRDVKIDIRLEAIIDVKKKYKL